MTKVSRHYHVMEQISHDVGGCQILGKFSFGPEPGSKRWLVWHVETLVIVFITPAGEEAATKVCKTLSETD